MTASVDAPEAESEAESARAPSGKAIFACMAFLSLIWGSTWIVIREGLDDLPALTSASARFVLAAIVMSAIAPTIARREGGGRPGIAISLVMGICNFGVSYGIVYYAETVLPSGLVSVLWSVFPMMMAVTGHFFLRGERLAARQWLGFAVGFAGVLLLLETDVRAVGADAVPVALLLLLSPAISAVGTTYVKRHGAGVSSALLNRNGMWIGAMLLGVFAMLLEADAAGTWSASAVGSVVYLAVVGTVVTFGLYFWALRHAPAYQLSLIAYVIPMIALALGAALRDEQISVWTLSGATAILAGVGFVLVGKRRPALLEDDRDRAGEVRR
ncbi:MAG: EamA family transporter [bacterium]|nr:EamA family transporter [bacterium]